MPPTAALPFRFRRGDHVVAAGEITATEETVHGLLRLDGDRLVLQWRTARKTERVGWEIRVDRELEPVRELAIPLSLGSGDDDRDPLARAHHVRSRARRCAGSGCGGRRASTWS